MPRIKPPFPRSQGLYAKPTVVNNVETLSTVPHIVDDGRRGVRARSASNRSTGTRIFSVSGHVKRPGNYEVELGMHVPRPHLRGSPAGSATARASKFFIPGGASFQWLVDEHLDAPLDMDSVQQDLGTMLGSGAMMVFDDTTDPVLVAWRLAKFFAHESCGKCTPCREGTGWIEKVLYRMAHGSGAPRTSTCCSTFGNNIAPGLNVAVHADDDLPARSERDVADGRACDKYFRDEIEERMTRDAEARGEIPVRSGTEPAVRAAV